MINLFGAWEWTIEDAARIAAMLVKTHYAKREARGHDVVFVTSQRYVKSMDTAFHEALFGTAAQRLPSCDTSEESMRLLNLVWRSRGMTSELLGSRLNVVVVADPYWSDEGQPLPKEEVDRWIQERVLTRLVGEGRLICVNVSTSSRLFADLQPHRR